MQKSVLPSSNEILAPNPLSFISAISTDSMFALESIHFNALHLRDQVPAGREKDASANSPVDSASFLWLNFNRSAHSISPFVSA